MYVTKLYLHIIGGKKTKPFKSFMLFYCLRDKFMFSYVYQLPDKIPVLGNYVSLKWFRVSFLSLIVENNKRRLKY